VSSLEAPLLDFVAVIFLFLMLLEDVSTTGLSLEISHTQRFHHGLDVLNTDDEFPLSVNKYRQKSYSRAQAFQ